MTNFIEICQLVKNPLETGGGGTRIFVYVSLFPLEIDQLVTVPVFTKIRNIDIPCLVRIMYLGNSTNIVDNNNCRDYVELVNILKIYSKFHLVAFT